MATWLTGLARVARKTGYPVVEVGGWKRRGFLRTPQGAVKGIVCHHTAHSKGNTLNAPSLNVVTHGRPRLPGPLSHYVLGRDGTIYVVAAGHCNHAGRVKQGWQSNSNTIGIEAENDGVGQTWPAKQLDAYVKLCRALIDEFKLGTKQVVGHKEISLEGKIDPNFSSPRLSMDEFRSYIARGGYTGVKAPDRAGKTAAKKAGKAEAQAAAKPAGKVWPAVKLPVTDRHTTASHNAWVKLMNDVGFRDKSLTKNIQSWLASARVGRYYRGRIDGVFGPMTVTALQRFLTGKRHYRGFVDGKRGPLTVRAEIQYLNDQARFYKNKK